MGVSSSPGGEGEAEVRWEALLPPCLGFSLSPEGQCGELGDWGLAGPSHPCPRPPHPLRRQQITVPD